MNDLDIAKEHLLSNNLSMVIVNNKTVIHESKARGIKPIFDVYTLTKESLKDSFVADRVIGKAAAMLLISGEIKALYTDLISEPAYELLINTDIELEFTKKVPMILNRSGDDMCPIEKISSKSSNIDELIKGITKFIEKMMNK